MEHLLQYFGELLAAAMPRRWQFGCTMLSLLLIAGFCWWLAPR